MASSVEDMISQLVGTIAGLQNARYTSAAATTIYLYDILLTLDMEMEHVWSRFSFNLPTLLYITNRYVCLGCFLVTTYNLAEFHGDFSDEYCRGPRELLGFILAHTGWTGIMTVRVCALWRQKTWLVRFIWVLWFCIMGTIIATAYLSYRDVTLTLSYNPYIKMCAPSSSPRILAVTPVPPAVYELFLTILTIVKAFDFGAYHSKSTTPRLFHVFARDGVAYFLMGTTISVGNMISWFALPSSQLYLFLYLYWALLATFIARLVLNLRVVHTRSIREQFGTSGVSANITFRSPTQSGFRSQGTKFFMGDGDLGVDTMPKLATVEEDEPWNVEVFHVTQITPPLPLKTLDAERRSLGGEHATNTDWAAEAHRRRSVADDSPVPQIVN